MTIDDPTMAEVWGNELFQYARNKSIELVGYPDFTAMCIAAIGKMYAEQQKLIKAQAQVNPTQIGG